MKIIAIVKNAKNTWTITEEKAGFAWYQDDLTVESKKTDEEKMFDIYTDYFDDPIPTGIYKKAATAIKKAAACLLNPEIIMM